MQERDLLIVVDKALGQARRALYELREVNEAVAEKLDAPISNAVTILVRRILALDRTKRRKETARTAPSWDKAEPLVVKAV